MADPYNHYDSFSTPTPGRARYYPSDDQSQNPVYGCQQQQYGTEGSYQPMPDPQAYIPQQSQGHLTPEPFGYTLKRSSTPTGQPVHQGPVIPAGYQYEQSKVPENASYYNEHPNHPDQQRYAPAKQPPAVYVSEADTPQGMSDDADRGLGGSLAGSAAGYYLGHKKEHGLLGAIGGALLGNFLEDKIKDHRRKDDDDRHEHDRHDHHHRHHHHHHHHHHRNRSHSRHSGHSHSGHSHSSRHSSHSRHRSEDVY